MRPWASRPKLVRSWIPPLGFRADCGRDYGLAMRPVKAFRAFSRRRPALADATPVLILLTRSCRPRHPPDLFLYLARIHLDGGIEQLAGEGRIDIERLLHPEIGLDQVVVLLHATSVDPAERLRRRELVCH